MFSQFSRIAILSACPSKLRRDPTLRLFTAHVLDKVHLSRMSMIFVFMLLWHRTGPYLSEDFVGCPKSGWLPAVRWWPERSSGGRSGQGGYGQNLFRRPMIDDCNYYYINEATICSAHWGRIWIIDTGIFSIFCPNWTSLVLFSVVSARRNVLMIQSNQKMYSFSILFFQ